VLLESVLTVMAEVTLQDNLLGKIAVRNNFISQAQLDECLDSIRLSEKKRPLGVILLSKGYITDEILEALLKIQNENEEQRELFLNRRMEDTLFSKLTLRYQLLTPEDIERCQEEQEKLEKVGQYLRLGQVMVRKKLLTTRDFLNLLEKQKSLHFHCKNCEAVFELKSALNGKKFRCADCEGVLTIPDVLKNIIYPKKIQGTSKVFHPLKSLRDRILENHQFGHFKVHEEIARGGMGIVFRATNTKNNQEVALKVLKEGESSSSEQVKRFQRESESASKLQHPYIVQVYETGIEDECHYFTMEYVNGDPLDQCILKEELSLETFLEILIKISKALHYAHEKGIIHRDIKPANILITKTKKPKLTDFGLAKDLDRQSMLTQSGAMVGTLYYMSPEQIKGGSSRKIDGRSDIYALGVILYEFLTSVLPFPGETTLEVYEKIVNGEVIPPRSLEESIEVDLQNIVLKALAKDPQSRYQNGEEFATDLKKYLGGQKVEAQSEFLLEKIRRLALKNLSALLATSVAFLLLLAFLFTLYLFKASSHLHQYQDSLERGLMYYNQSKNLDSPHNLKISAQKALQEFTQALTLFPEKNDPYFYRIQTYLLLQDFQSANQDIDTLLERTPEDPALYFQQGKNYYNLGKQSEGDFRISFFKQSLQSFKKCAAKDQGVGNFKEQLEDWTQLLKQEMKD
jgi:serine/threonine protein kinase